MTLPRAFALGAAIVIVAFVGDAVAFPQPNMYMRAALDSATHAALAGLTWALACALSRTPTHRGALRTEIVIACLAGSAVDADHFAEARSLSLERAMHLERRPVGHALLTAFCVCASVAAIAPIALLPSVQRLILRLPPPLRPVVTGVASPRGAGIVLVAWSAHLLRDASRRGLNFTPAAATAPVPQPLYVAGTCMLAWAAARAVRAGPSAGGASSRTRGESERAAEVV